MRTETQTVRIGERVSDIDWSYDFRQHFDSMCSSDERKDERCEQSKAMLRKIEQALKNGREIRATTYGGWPRCGLHPVVAVGMYDGWPYWKPVPSVQTRGPLGCEWHCFASITEIQEPHP